MSGNPELVEERTPSPRPLVAVDLAEHDSVLVVAVTGEVDLASAPHVRAALERAVDRLGGRRLVVDLHEVTFLGSAGLAALAEAADAVAGLPGQRGQQVAVAVPDGPVGRVLGWGGLDEVLQVVDRVEAAVPG